MAGPGFIPPSQVNPVLPLPVVYFNEVLKQQVYLESRDHLK